MTAAQRKKLIITLIVLIPLTISVFLIRDGTPAIYLYSKAAFSLGFVFYALITIHRTKTPDTLAMVSLSALIIGMVGDIFIFIANRIEGVGSMPGSALFLIQHILMCAGLLIYAKNSGRRKRLFIVLPVTAAGVCLYVFILYCIGGDAFGSIAVPMTVYAVILAWAAAIPFTVREKGDSRLLLLGIAGVIFYAADSLLICGRIDSAPPIIPAINLIPYYYAQYLIAFSTGMTDSKGGQK